MNETLPDYILKSSTPTLDAFFYMMIQRQGIEKSNKILQERFNKKTQN